MEILQARILGIFPTQELNPGLPHCRGILYQLSHQESPRIREWVAHPFSRDLPHPGMEPRSPALQVDSLPTELSGKSYELGGDGFRILQVHYAYSALYSNLMLLLI